MQDKFNNCDLIIKNATQVNTGLNPIKDKIGQVIFKPKEDQWLMTSRLDGLNVIHSPSAAFQVTTEEISPLRMGLGVIEDDHLEPFFWIERDVDGELYWLYNLYGEKLRGKIPYAKHSETHHRTFSLKYISGAYFFNYFNMVDTPIPKHVILQDVPPVYFVDFESILKAAFIGPIDKPIEKVRNNITEKPNYFIKDYNA